MAQASNAPAREPSMEEILASIRRIIEDSDGARRATDDHDHIFDEPAPVAETDVRADFHREAEEIVPEVEAFRSELTEPAAAEAARPSAEPVESMLQINGARPARRGLDRHPSADAPAAHDEPLRPEPTPRQEREASAEESGGGSRGAIISDFAGRQVAAAFEELSEAFSASRKRSYDEIAEEIMRPMLQDWLDNNLPLLVERLVREEIERVARGGGR